MLHNRLIAMDLPLPLRTYLEHHHVMTLATQGDDGPWAAAVFYVLDGEGLVFLSSPRTRHCRNLSRDARGAVTIHDECRQWSEIKGVQLEGRVVELQGELEALARRRYTERFPVARGLDNAAAPLVQALAKVRWYRFVPNWVRLIDNSRGFGHRDEFVLTGRDTPTADPGQ